MKSKQVFRDEKKWRLSGTKANARYRGVTDLEQYSNFVLESAHDMNLLSHVLTGNKKINMPGHEKAIENNYIALFNGGVSPVMYDSFTASNLMKIDKKRPINVPPLESWESVGGCVVSKTVTGYSLTSPGLVSACGIRTGLFVQSGDVLCIRLRAKTAEAIPDFTIGSENVNGIGSLKKSAIAVDSYGFYVDYRLYCKNHETIFLNIYVHYEPENEVVASSVELMDIGLYYGEEIEVSVTPLNGELKTDLNRMRETLNFLKN
jgi:hypothetical protein